MKHIHAVPSEVFTSDYAKTRTICVTVEQVLAGHPESQARIDLNVVLSHHHLTADDETLVYACLGCGSVGLCRGAVEPLMHDQFNFQCCGFTVLFNTGQVRS